MRLSVDWYKEYSNLPQLILHLDQPHQPDFKYQHFKDEGYYYGENGNFADFLAYRGPGRGFSGQTLTLEMLDGSYHSLTGPWSGNITQVNALRLWDKYPGSKQPVVSVIQHWGYSMFVSNILLPWALILPKAEEFHIVCYLDNHQVYPNWKDLPPGTPFQFVPSLSETEIVKPC